MVSIKGKVPAHLQKQLETKVEAFDKANPSLSTHDDVTFQVKDEDGKPSEVKGAFSRGPLGQVVFVLLSWAGSELAKVIHANRMTSKEKRNSRRSKRVANRIADVVSEMPNDAEGRFKYFVELNMLKKHGKGYIMSGGLKFPDRDAVIAHLSEVSDAGSGGTKKAAKKAAAPKAKKAAPKKAAKKK
jgi:hypothetical protein